MDKNYKALLEKIPAIGAITDDKVKELGYINVCQEEATAIPGVNENSRRKTDILIAGAVLSNKGEPLHTADAINWADRLKNLATQSRKTKIAVVSLGRPPR